MRSPGADMLALDDRGEATQRLMPGRAPSREPIQ